MLYTTLDHVVSLKIEEMAMYGPMNVELRFFKGSVEGAMFLVFARRLPNAS